MPKCANCKEREGTKKWGEGGTMIARGYYSMWCEVCVLKKQIEHAEERAAALPDLQARLWSLLTGEGV